MIDQIFCWCGVPAPHAQHASLLRDGVSLEHVKTLYLAGPGFSALAFEESARKLHQAGFEVADPAATAPACRSYKDFIDWTLATLSSGVGVATMHGWQSAPESMLAVRYSRALGNPDLSVTDWLRVAGAVTVR